MGRKPLSDSAKVAQLRIMLSFSERAELDAAATAAGCGVSTWARDILLTAARASAVTASQKTAAKPRKSTPPKA